MGDPRRFNVMADAITQRWPDRGVRFADVAAGKGYLYAAMYQRGYRNGVCFDKRARKARRPYYEHRWFDRHVRDSFDLLLGMHPDEATDLIISEAARRRVPFAIVPCCARPTATTFDGTDRDYDAWVAHLVGHAEGLGFTLAYETLNISGRSLMIVGSI